MDSTRFKVTDTGHEETFGNNFLVVSFHRSFDVYNLLAYTCFSSRVNKLFKGILVV